MRTDYGRNVFFGAISTKNRTFPPRHARDNYRKSSKKSAVSAGVDAVGIDYCGQGPATVQSDYKRFADGIVASGRDMQLGMWNLGEGAAYKWAPTMSENMTAHTASNGRTGSWVPHLRLTADIGNSWDSPIPPTMTVMATLDQIQGIDDLWDYGMGNSSGANPLLCVHIRTHKNCCALHPTPRAQCVFAAGEFAQASCGKNDEKPSVRHRTMELKKSNTHDVPLLKHIITCCFAC